MIISRIYGEGDAKTANIHMYIGALYRRQGRLNDAFDQYRRTLEIEWSCPVTVAEAMAGVGDTCYSRECYDEVLRECSKDQTERTRR